MSRALALACKTATFVLAAAGCGTEDDGAPNGEQTPKGTYLQGRECERCLADTCYREALACDSDSGCSKEIDCRLACSDPVCQYRCTTTSDSSNRTAAALRGCASYGCRSECRIGRAFDCVGAYKTPEMFGLERRELRLIEMRGAPLVSAAVTLCSSREPPCDELDQGMTDAEGRVTLNMPANWDYHGAIELSHPDYGDVVAWGSGVRPDAPGVITFSFASNLQLLANARMVLLDPEGAHLEGTIYDCNGRPASDLVLAVEPEKTGMVLWASVSWGETAKLMQTNGGGSFKGINFPEGPVELIASEQSTGREVVRERLVIRSQWHYFGPLYPRTTENVRDLGP